MLGADEGGGLGFGVVLQNAEWKKFATKDFLAQKKVIQRFRNNLEVMILLSYLVPLGNEPMVAGPDGLKPVEPAKGHSKVRMSGYGIYALGSDGFVAGMTIGEAILRHKDDRPLKKLLDLQSMVQTEKLLRRQHSSGGTGIVPALWRETGQGT